MLIVSNRLPVTVRHEHTKLTVSPSAGGLATAMKGPHRNSDALWVGWPGELGRINDEQTKQIEREFEKQRLVPVYLTSNQVKRFYEGFSNGVLWPLYHYDTEKVQRDAWANWNTFVEVNRLFAEQAAASAAPGDLVWVHDYQLSLMPAMLRRLRPDVTIGFFLHIPFPSSEVFRILPWRNEILEGMLGADLIGFHTFSYLRHFRQTVTSVLRLPTRGETVTIGDREARLGVYPIGIDASYFMGLAEDPEIRKETTRLIEEAGGRRILLGVDRLDYTKGLPRRLLAVERFLERNPEWRDRIRFLQLTVPSRSQVESYARLRKELDEIAGRINAAHGTFGSLPVHYLVRSVDDRALAALYAAADVMLVTPVRDGMNLVAKEYVAMRSNADGVLILSEFAGAAAEMTEALIVNPFDIDQLAQYIKRALTMPKNEVQRRMKRLRQRVIGYDAFAWAEDFIAGLKEMSSSSVPARPGLTPPGDIDALAERLKSLPSLTILLDYDGTLVPFSDDPEAAIPDEELLALLKRLARRPETLVHIVSGRAREQLDEWFGGLPIALHAEHGLWLHPDKETGWKSRIPLEEPIRDLLRPLFRRFTRSTPGSRLEEKSAGFCWHFRAAEQDFGQEQAGRLAEAIERLLVANGLSDRCEVLRGSFVVETRPAGINKGLAVKELIDNNTIDNRMLVMGDDRTDEDMFMALPPEATAIHIGPSHSVANWRIPDPETARAFLRKLIE
ncbi:bifunctional alpha,alpha-trehalose-phosphate synthase (UDP-forming)/trehalose-phosphatase [Candidatus Ozemobacteraceae bacterium]|nr:bifunctional alpha,alpha-trehalose-phosphate synthase (UDP-forming)/trehalose-phosphatase [Candidatus Ozemobacteraceae bacterium]